MDKSILDRSDYQDTVRQARALIEAMIRASLADDNDIDPENFIEKNRRQLQAQSFIMAYSGEEHAVAYSVLKNDLNIVEACICYLVSICVSRLSPKTAAEGSEPYLELLSVVGPLAEKFRDRFNAGQFIADVADFRPN
jgi:hypothetical protein